MNLRKDQCGERGGEMGLRSRLPKLARGGVAVGEQCRLSTMDLWALATMKNAARCEKQCDLHV